MPHSLSLILLIPMLLVNASCDAGPTSLDGIVVVRTDESRYGVDEPVMITVENRGRFSLVFHHCNGRLSFEVEKRVEQQWEDQGGVATICLAVYRSGEYGLEPGAIYRDSVRIDVPGTYRLRFIAGRDGRVRVDSNTFDVK